MRRLLPVFGMLLLMNFVPAHAQNIASFREELRDLDPSGDVFIKAEHIGDGLAYVYVTDGWYGLECYQKERFYKVLRSLWQEHGGSNIVIKDAYGEKVGDFTVFGGVKIKGC